MDENTVPLEEMSKLELEKYARENLGVELNRASSKEHLIAEIRAMEHSDKQAPLEEDAPAELPEVMEEVEREAAEDLGVTEEGPKPKKKKEKKKTFDEVLKAMQVEANDASMKKPHHPDCHSYGTNPQCKNCDPSLPGAMEIFGA